MSLTREPYSCRAVYHPELTCKAYLFSKVKRAILNCYKITIIASLIPQFIRKRKKIFSGDTKTKLKALRQVITRFIRATAFLALGTSLPFIIVCNFPLNSDPFYFLPFGVRITLFYAYPAILSSLILELPTKMPSYMGFFISKAISMAWGLIKTYNVMPFAIPFEKQLGLALICSLIGFVSVKKARMKAIR